MIQHTGHPSSRLVVFLPGSRFCSVFSLLRKGELSWGKEREKPGEARLFLGMALFKSGLGSEGGCSHGVFVQVL